MSSLQGVGIERIALYTEVSSLQGVGIERITLYTEVSSLQGVGIERITLYTEVSSLQGVGIERFHCIQRCPHFRELEYRGSTVYRGLLTSGGWNREDYTVYRGVLTSGGWNREVPLYTEVSSLQGVGIERFHCIQRSPHFRGLE